jgi:hypothetical protein
VGPVARDASTLSIVFESLGREAGPVQMSKHRRDVS